MLIATHSGLRGRPGVELSRATATLVGSFVELVERGGSATVAVAQDGRRAAVALAGEVVEKARAHGADVVDFGTVSTPTAKAAARARRLDGVLVVTGSHLDGGWTGVKPIAAPLYIPVDVRELAPPVRPPGRHGRLEVDDGAAEAHAVALLAAVDVETVRRARLSATVAGGAGRAAELVLERLGSAAGAGRPDLCLDLDADGDRVELRDERGRPLGPEATLPLVALARRPATIVKGGDTGTAVDRIAAEWQATVHVVPPGELNLVRGIATHGAALAGEGNGGVVVPVVGLARDGLAAGVSVLELMARTGSTLSELAATLPAVAMRRSAVPVGAAAADGLVRAARRLGEDLRDPQLGIRVDRPSGAWGLLRQSATEHVVRITAEATDVREAEALHDELRAALLSR